MTDEPTAIHFKGNVWWGGLEGEWHLIHPSDATKLAEHFEMIPEADWFRPEAQRFAGDLRNALAEMERTNVG